MVFWFFTLFFIANGSFVRGNPVIFSRNLDEFYSTIQEQKHQERNKIHCLKERELGRFASSCLLRDRKALLVVKNSSDWQRLWRRWSQYCLAKYRLIKETAVIDELLKIKELGEKCHQALKEHKIDLIYIDEGETLFVGPDLE